MLQLKQITKVYPAGGDNVRALRGIDLQFRESEFVSILGPSGCGKTTMLNIIGGLDHYTSGDLIINGRSTKDFKDRDWDAYRNHSIGFVFQSYNLIPHQTVLQNVELALTLSGVSKAERRRRARQALADVGLSSQLHKRPGEMSGGQMQRVAIARAIVNDPDIVLADEPTGALDTETSVQVMEILKEISKDRLVIMVTHNPDLAERYSTRIIRMLDGEITGDSMPLTEEEQTAPPKVTTATGKRKLPSMSFATSFGLSLKNLFTKKGRTTLTAFAGSIGIIGIALISAVSQGTTNYIDTVQEETLSSYPLTLAAQHVDIGSLLATFMESAKSTGDHERDAVYQKAMIYNLINSLNSLEESKNDLASFKKYLEERLADEEDASGLRDALNGVQYAYDLDLLIYTENVDGTVQISDTASLMREMIADYMGMNFAAGAEGTATSSPMSSLMGSGNAGGSSLWQEMLPGLAGEPINDLLKNQYDVVYGRWPEAYDEIVLVLDENNELDDMSLYALGLIPKSEIDAIMEASVNKTTLDVNAKKWSYEEICGKTFRTVQNADCFVKDDQTGIYTDLREIEAGLRYLYDRGLSLKVTGVIRPNEDALAAMLSGSIGYTHALTEHIITKAHDSAAVQAQKADTAVDVFTGLPFRAGEGTLTAEDKAAAFRARAEQMTAAEKAAAYVAIASIPPKEQLDAAVAQTLGSMTRADMEAALLGSLTAQMGVDAATVQEYLAGMSDEEMAGLMEKGVREKVTAEFAAGVQAQLAAMSEAQLAGALDMALPTYTAEQAAAYYDTVLEFSDATYEENLQKLGCVELSDPATISLFASSFDNKDIIEEAIAAYNDGVEELSRIAYTDYVGIMMSSVTTIIDAITYVLIAFVAISLVVSAIMIGVITLISVQERTKEIGILRAIGASKKNVSSMFNAETVIIGFAAGALGVVVTYLLCIPINLLLHHLTGIGNLNAVLAPEVAVALILISVLLTLVAGIIPSRSAAKKDPVVALRTE